MSGTISFSTRTNASRFGIFTHYPRTASNSAISHSPHIGGTSIIVDPRGIRSPASSLKTGSESFLKFREKRPFERGKSFILNRFTVPKAFWDSVGQWDTGYEGKHGSMTYFTEMVPSSPIF